MTTDPLVGLQAASASVARFPYPTMVRRQYTASIVNVIHKLAPNIGIDQKLADGIYNIGRTVSPYDTTVLFGRVEYLFNFGPHDQIPPVLNMMKRVASNLPETWLAEAYYDALVGNVEGMRNATSVGLALKPNDPTILERLTSLSQIGATQ